MILAFKRNDQLELNATVLKIVSYDRIFIVFVGLTDYFTELRYFIKCFLFSKGMTSWAPTARASNNWMWKSRKLSLTIRYLLYLSDLRTILRNCAISLNASCFQKEWPVEQRQLEPVTIECERTENCLLRSDIYCICRTSGLFYGIALLL